MIRGKRICMLAFSFLASCHAGQSFGLRSAGFAALAPGAFRTSSLKASTKDDVEATIKKPVPMTLLAGFLGTGKTSALKHLLENTENIKIGVIVNDVASVNIDAKLISGQTGDMIELQNGCACCSLADELFFSVEKLLANRDFDAIVIELSGVADPMAIKNNWKMSPIEVRQMAQIQKVVTVVDSQTFGSDYMTWDMVQDRKGWADPNDACAANQKVSELLAEQVEAADLILLNKVDLAGPDQVEVAYKVASALNEKAVFVRVEFGKVSPMTILGAALTGNIDENCDDPDCTDTKHSHSHDHACEEADCTDASHSHAHDHACEDSDCADSSHAHAHDHASEVADASHSHSHDHACEDSDCTDASHSHSHDHACEDSDCTDASHSHSHDHACEDADCTDTSHSHSHDHACEDAACTDTSHSHSHSHATSTDALGIKNFVYKGVRPFSTRRLLALLNRWPVPKKEVLDLEFLQEAGNPSIDVFGKSTEGNPFVGVLRSKGFCWFAPNKWDGVLDDSWRHDTAMYLSHAGRHMSVNTAGKWWATIPKETLPKYFEDDNKPELERILREDFVSTEFGDRRQELVFIGVDIDETAIRNALDKCLLTDKEMNDYRQELSNLQMATFTTSATGLYGRGGLFDVDSTEHLDQAR